MTDAQSAPETTAPPATAAPSPPPAPEPAQAEAPADDGRQPEPPTPQANIRTALTDNGRRNKAATEALGLNKNATAEQMVEAINALQRRAVAPVEDGYEMPPEVVAERQRLSERAWQSAERDFGEDFTMQAQGLRELVLNSDDDYELVAALHQMSQPEPKEAPGSEPDPAPAPAAAQPQQANPNVAAEVGKPSWKVTPDEDDKPGTGDTRGFFQRVLSPKS